MLLLRDAKRRLLYIGAGRSRSALAAIPFLPSSFTNRMETIQGYQADESAGTRLAVWGWTWNYVLDHPGGGGFEAYRQNRIQVNMVNPDAAETGDRRRPERRRRGPRLSQRLFRDARRAGLSRPDPLPADPRHRPGPDGGDPAALPARRRARTPGSRRSPPRCRISSSSIWSARSSSASPIQPFVYLMIATQIGFDAWLTRRERARTATRWVTATASRLRLLFRNEAAARGL